MKQDNKFIIGIAVASILLFVGGIFLFSKGSKPKVFNPDLLVRENSSKTTSENSKVTLVEFGDYQCPACAATSPIVDQIVKDYAGQVTFVFRHFPLPQHKNATIASEAVEAAGEQGKYWEMHSLVYTKQAEWSGVDDALPTFVTYAESLGLKIADFEKAIKEGKYKDKITNDQKDGVAIGVNSTPTFFINSEKFSGPYDYNGLKTKIDSLIK